MSILVFDNYDSFTYNLVSYIRQSTSEKIEVHRNDKISLAEINRFDKILLSPGPGIPSEAGILIELIKTYAATKNIFGVCLGLQAIVEAFGGSLVNLNEVYHGVATPIKIIKEDFIFEKLPKTISVGRYHSWVADNKQIPKELIVTALDSKKEVMAIKHKQYNVRAVQFHPESILTEKGLTIIKNWVNHK